MNEKVVLLKDLVVKSDLSAVVTKLVAAFQAGDTAVTNAFKAAIGELGKTDGENPVDHTVKSYVDAAIAGVTSDASALKTKVETLIGTDEGKSARTIANEEMAAVLLVDPATGEKNFQTLQALAAYLEDHPEEVADILSKIKGITDKLGELPTGEGAPATFAAWIQKVIADKTASEKAITDRLDVIEGEGEGSIKKAVKDLADGQVKTNKEAIDAINNESTGILKQAKDYADTKKAEAISTVQGESTKTVKDMEDAFASITTMSAAGLAEVLALIP